MKIAIPTMDGHSISQHFGRCKAFLVYETNGVSIQSKEVRENGHACSGHHSGASHESGHNHGGFLNLLGDCQAVVVKGIGGGAMQALRSGGLQICVLQEECSPEEAALLFASGALAESLGGSCACHH